MLTATDNEIIAKAVAAALRSMNYKLNNVPDANRPNKGNDKCTICNCDSCEAELWAKESGKDIEEECHMLCDGNPIESPPHDITLGRGEKSYIRVGRSFLRANPTVKCIKDMSFQQLADGAAGLTSGEQSRPSGNGIRWANQVSPRGVTAILSCAERTALEIPGLPGK